MTLPITGTATVTGGINVTWTGVALTPVNCAEGFPVIIDGQASHVLSRTDTSHFVLQTAVDNGTGLTCAISNYTSQEMQIATLNARAAEVGERLSVVDAYGRGLFFNMIGPTGANDPQPTFMATNGALSNPEGITELYFDVLDAKNLDVSGIIDLWDTDTVVIVRSIETNAYFALILTEASTNQGPDAWRSCVGEVRTGMHDGVITAGEAVTVEWNRTNKGLQIDAVGLEADLSDYDGEDAGFVFLATDHEFEVGQPRGAIFIKNSNTSADWADPVPLEGPQGIQGVAATITVGTVTSGASGSDAVVTNSGTAQDAVLDFTIPRGNTGLPGAFTGDERIIAAASGTVTIADRGSIVLADWPTAVSIVLDSAATLEEDWMGIVGNIGAGDATISIDGAELFDNGEATIVLETGESLVLQSNGTVIRPLLRGGGAGGGGGVTPERWGGVGNGTTNITLPWTPASEDSTLVFVNGSDPYDNTLFSISGNDIVFTEVMTTGDRIQVFGLKGGASQLGASILSQTYTLDGSTTVLTLPGEPVNDAGLMLFTGGLKQRLTNGVDYTYTGTTLTLTETIGTVANSVTVEAIVFQSLAIAVPANESVGADQIKASNAAAIKTKLGLSRVAFTATRNAGTAVSATNEITGWTSVTNEGVAFSTLTGRFTAPVSGLYQFEANVTSQNNVNGMTLQLYKSGTSIGVQGYGGSPTTPAVLSAYITLNAGQYVSLFVTFGSSYTGPMTFSGRLVEAD